MAKHNPHKRKQTGFRIRPDLLERALKLKETEGIPIAFQVESALEQWLNARDRKKGGKK